MSRNVGSKWEAGGWAVIGRGWRIGGNVLEKGWKIREGAVGVWRIGEEQ